MADRHPIHDNWFLAHPKRVNGTAYYGAYPHGFPERARVLICANIDDPVLHVCAGMVRHYPVAGGFGPNDKTLDLAPECEPDFLQDAREPFPVCRLDPRASFATPEGRPRMWRAVLIDPPYGPDHAAKYSPGPDTYPAPQRLVLNALDVVPRGGKVGLLHQMVPSIPSARAKTIAEVSVIVGTNQRGRVFTVWERVD